MKNRLAFTASPFLLLFGFFGFLGFLFFLFYEEKGGGGGECQYCGYYYYRDGHLFFLGEQCELSRRLHAAF